MLLLTYLVKGFNIRFKKLLNLLVGHFGPPTIGLTFKSFSSEMVISSLFCYLIALYKISDLCILGRSSPEWLYLHTSMYHCTWSLP